VENRKVVAAELFDCLLKDVIGDESWVLNYDPEKTH
jgi:hypothetical protein